MGQKISAVKIKYKNGTYSNEIPLAINAENVFYNKESLLSHLSFFENKVEKDIDSVKQEIAQTKANGIITIDQYSHLVDYSKDANGDWSTALQTAINKNATVIINKNIRIWQRIKIPANKNVVLLGVSVTKPEEAGVEANNPDFSAAMFYLSGDHASLTGTGSNSRILCQTPSPDGIVKIGQDSNTVASVQVEWATLSKLRIRGRYVNSSNNGNSGENKGVHLCGTYTSGAPAGAWFCWISDLKIEYVAMGIVFNNAASANIVTNMEFYQCGYSKTTGAYCFIRTQEIPVVGGEEKLINVIPLENSIQNCFHHGSANASTICMMSATGLNRFDGIISEPGGNARGLYFNPDETVMENGRNVIKFTGEVAYSLDVPDKFYRRNVIETKISYANQNITAYESLTAKGSIKQSGHEIWGIESNKLLQEGTEYTIATLPFYKAKTGDQPIGRHRWCICRIMGVVDHLNVPSLSQYKTEEYLLKYSYTGSGSAQQPVLTVSPLSYSVELAGDMTPITLNSGTLNLSVIKAVKVVNEKEIDAFVIRMKTPDNGTKTTQMNAMITVEMLGHFPNFGLELGENFIRMD